MIVLPQSTIHLVVTYLANPLTASEAEYRSFSYYLCSANYLIYYLLTPAASFDLSIT